MDLFEKCRSFTRADETKALGLYPYFRPIEESEGPVVRIGGKKVIMAGSNNYLGLTADPRVKEAAVKATEKYGTGCSGSRYLTGTLDLHVELEERLAAFFGKEDCLLYSTGYQTAQGVIPTLVQRGEFVVSDKDNHACIVAGNLMAAGAASYVPNGEQGVVRYKHNDMKHLETVISKLPREAAKLIVSDGVFSTSGEIVDLPNMVQVARKYNARVMVDDAHAVGVIGKGGRGTASHYGLEKETDLTMGTFSKTFAVTGGYVAGSRQLVDYLRFFSRSYMFSASLTPPVVASVLAGIEFLEQHPERVRQLRENVQYLLGGLRAAGYDVSCQSAILPIFIPQHINIRKVISRLHQEGIFVNGISYPAVSKDRQRLRVSVMATLTRPDLDFAVDKFAKVGREFGILSK